MRAGAYSPNHIGNDAAIFNAVADQLRKRGCEVNVYSEEQFNDDGIRGERVILAMCRDMRSIKKLQALEDEGCIVINSGYGIENCTRERMTRILLGSGIPYPESMTVNTDEAVRDALVRAGMDRVWIKRGDLHAMHKEDVSFVRHAEEAQEVLQEYFLRGIKRAVINRHLEGDLVKFYGVAGTDFFYWFCPFRDSRDAVKNGTSEAAAPKFEPSVLRGICEKAAGLLDILIYGGDCIVGEDGTLRIIDFDDWPSFAPCRAEAAPYIARAVLAEFKKHKK